TAVCYQQGTMALYEVREYLLEKWGRKCAYCKASEVPLQIEHIFTKSRGGTNRASNLMFACNGCNKAKDSLSVQVFLATGPKRIARILAQAKAQLKDAPAVNATRWALWRSLKNTRVVVFGGSRGHTKWNRSRFSVPKPHALDVVCVRNTSGVASYPTRVLATKAAGRGSCALTRSDVYGSPRLYLPLTKVHHRFATGDLVLAVVPTGNLAGVYVGRVAVCSSGSFNIKAKGEAVQGISYRYRTLLRRRDGWGYEQQQELGLAARVRLSLSTARVGGFSSHTHF
ncbi:MAG: HNH endonuclease, partial [Acidimicrobiales bacterium]